MAGGFIKVRFSAAATELAKGTVRKSHYFFARLIGDFPVFSVPVLVQLLNRLLACVKHYVTPFLGVTPVTGFGLLYQLRCPSRILGLLSRFFHPRPVEVGLLPGLNPCCLI
jgi:hypothetical protein